MSLNKGLMERFGFSEMKIVKMRELFEAILCDLFKIELKYLFLKANSKNFHKYENKIK